MSQQLKTKKPKLKICGVTIPSDAFHCCRLGVDYVGFNLYPGSKRFITAATARQTWLDATKQLSTSTLPAIVMVDHTPEQLATTLKAFPEARVVQIHNVTAVAELEPLRRIIGDRELWAGVAIKGGLDLKLAVECSGAADLVLLDSAVIPSGSTVAGGSGQAFDWGLLASVDQVSAFGVAGGLTEANLPDLAKVGTPQLLDVCSGVEQAPGIKDPAKIDALITTVRSLW